MAMATKEELKIAIAARMGTTVTNMDSMGPHLDALCEECYQSAANEIYSILIGRGYSKADIDAWDGLKSFSIRLGCCHVLRSLPNKDIKITEICKCEDDLRKPEFAITSNGVAIGYTNGGTTSGQMTETEDDITLRRKIADERFLQ